MKLVDNLSATIVLPSDLLWSDEFDWSSVSGEKTWGVSGSLIIQKNTKLAGRPISLKSPQLDQGWMYRSELVTLYTWAAAAAKTMTLHLERPDDTRTFQVIFDPDRGSGGPIKAVPVKGWADHRPDDPYQVEIYLLEI